MSDFYHSAKSCTRNITLGRHALSHASRHLEHASWTPAIVVIYRKSRVGTLIDKLDPTRSSRMLLHIVELSVTILIAIR